MAMNRNILRTITTIVTVAFIFLTAGRGPVEKKAFAAETQLPLHGLRVAIVTGEGFQDQEALMPLAFLKNRGAEVTVVGPKLAKVKAYNSDIHLIIEEAVEDVSAADFDALVLPGGKAPAKIRQNKDIVSLVRKIFEAGKPVAAICHGPQVLVKAGVIDGRKMTCYAGMADELRAGGANYKDEAVVRDGNLVTSRVPTDIPAWLGTMEKLFAKAQMAK
ncbi:MAG: type 1 glutamine amidotransferase domain-containing protein [Planctomycetota bacterium]